MMVAVASAAPMPLRVEDESPATYLEALRSAADQLIRNGTPVLIRAIPIQTTR